MTLHDFAAIPVREIAPGVRGRYAHSEQITGEIVDLAQGAVVPDHAHPHEQWTMVRYSAVARVACQVFDVFHPVRTDHR